MGVGLGLPRTLLCLLLPDERAGLCPREPEALEPLEWANGGFGGPMRAGSWPFMAAIAAAFDPNIILVSIWFCAIRAWF